MIGLSALLPAESGAAVVTALDRLADQIPDLPEDNASLEASGAFFGEPTPQERRRADALVMLASKTLGADPDKDRATIVIHEQLSNLLDPEGRGSSLPGGGVVHPEVVRRLCCDGRIQTVLEDGRGMPIGIGDVSRTIPGWMRRMLVHRDEGCTFPGCNATRYLDGHHIVWWTEGGRTDLDNLTLVCGHHHKLVHEFGWTVELDERQRTHWFRPDGTPAEAVRLPRGPTSDALAERGRPPPPERPRQPTIIDIAAEERPLVDLDQVMTRLRGGLV